MLVLARQVVLREGILPPLGADHPHLLQEQPREFHDLVVPRGVGHVQVGRVRLTAKRHALDLHKGAVAEGDQPCVAPDVVRVPPLDDGKAGDGPLPLALQARQRRPEAFPRVVEQRPVDGLQALGRGGVHADVLLFFQDVYTMRDTHC